MSYEYAFFFCPCFLFCKTKQRDNNKKTAPKIIIIKMNAKTQKKYRKLSSLIVTGILSEYMSTLYFQAVFICFFSLLFSVLFWLYCLGRDFFSKKQKVLTPPQNTKLKPFLFSIMRICVTPSPIPLKGIKNSVLRETFFKILSRIFVNLKGYTFQ